MSSFGDKLKYLAYNLLLLTFTIVLVELRQSDFPLMVKYKDRFDHCCTRLWRNIKGKSRQIQRLQLLQPLHHVTCACLPPYLNGLEWLQTAVKAAPKHVTRPLFRNRNIFFPQSLVQCYLSILLTLHYIQNIGFFYQIIISSL